MRPLENDLVQIAYEKGLAREIQLALATVEGTKGRRAQVSVERRSFADGRRHYFRQCFADPCLRALVLVLCQRAQGATGGRACAAF